jgi:hypothetical protein
LRETCFLIAPRACALCGCAEELLQEPVFAEEVRRELSYRPTASKFDYSNRIVRHCVAGYAAIRNADSALLRRLSLAATRFV